jgi:hypothetical protein
MGCGVIDLPRILYINFVYNNYISHGSVKYLAMLAVYCIEIQKIWKQFSKIMCSENQ